MFYEKKGNKITFDQTSLEEYLEKKLQELANLISNMSLALIVITLLVIIQMLRVSDLFLYALILVPFISKGFIFSKVQSHLRKSFGELLNQ